MLEKMETKESLIRCSNACTRAGLSAMLAVAAALAMLQPLLKAKALDSYLQYANLRFELQDRTRTLKNARCWKRHVKRKGEEYYLRAQLLHVDRLGCREYETRWILDELQNKELASTSNRGGFDIVPAPPIITKPKNQTGIPDKTSPAAPTGLTMRSADSYPETAHMTHGKEISQVFYDLFAEGIHKRLKNSNYTTRSSRSVARWEDLLFQRLNENGWKPRTPKTQSENNDTTRLLLEINIETFLYHLKFGNVFELANFELPDLSEEDLFRAQSRVMLPQIPIPLDLRTGTILVQFAFFLSLGYFLLYLKEAMRLVGNGTTDETGTFFSVFSRSNLSRFIFQILVALPPIMSFVLAKIAFSFSEPASYVNFLICFLVVLLWYSIAKNALLSFLRKRLKGN